MKHESSNMIVIAMQKERVPFLHSLSIRLVCLAPMYIYQYIDKCSIEVATTDSAAPAHKHNSFQKHSSLRQTE